MCGRLRYVRMTWRAAAQRLSVSWDTTRRGAQGKRASVVAARTAGTACARAQASDLWQFRQVSSEQGARGFHRPRGVTNDFSEMPWNHLKNLYPTFILFLRIFENLLCRNFSIEILEISTLARKILKLFRSFKLQKVRNADLVLKCRTSFVSVKIRNLLHKCVI